MLHGWWWKWLVETMTGGGGGGGGRREMNMARGAEGGCGTEEKACPVSIPSGNNNIAARDPPSVEIADKSLNYEEIEHLKVPMETSSSSVDFFSQARKALCLRSPYDADDASAQTPSTSASASVLSTNFLPSGLAQLLTKHSDGSRKRHKKSHSGGEHKVRQEKSRGTNIWTETEEYFRELTVEDIDKLYQGSCLGFSGSDKYFTIPILDNVGSVCNLCTMGNLSNNDIGNAGSGGIGIDMDYKGCEVREEDKGEGVKEDNDPQFMDVDIIGEGNEVEKSEEEGKEEKGAKEEKGVKGGIALNGIEWLLGSRSKIYLTSERPSKKRKHLGGDAGLEKLLVTRPVDGSSSLCHYCSVGDMGDQLNRLLVCSSCGVAVHQRCYGVQDDVDGTWLCSWCKQRKDCQSGERPCLLCPKQGGALKPVQRRENQGPSVEYAHLFCCQWMPEVYVENIRIMEPIMNTDGINDTRRKLVCCLCKVKCGACVRCSNGACRTAFHPLCAREARHRMEIWGRLGCDEVELRAFCAKHSEVENGISSQCTGDVFAPTDSDLKNQALMPSGNKIHNLKIGTRNGDKIGVNVETNDLNLAADKMNNQILHVDGLLENRSNSKIQSEIVDVQQHISNDTAELDICEDANSSVSLNFNMILKKLIDQGEVDLKDLAEEFGVSPDMLTPLLTDNHNLNGKVETWLKDHGYVGSLPKPLKVKIKSSASLKSEAHIGTHLETENVVVAGTDSAHVLPVKCIPPRRRTKSDMRILRNEKVACTSNEMICDDMLMDENAIVLPNGDDCHSKESSDVIEKKLDEALDLRDISSLDPEKSEVEPSPGVAIGIPENGSPKGDSVSEQSDIAVSDLQKAKLSAVFDICPVFKKSDSSYTHPLIQHKLIGMDNGFEYEGSREREFSQLGASSSSGICCNRHGQQSTSTDWISKLNRANFGQLVKARNTGVLQLSPSDEVEGELIFYQHKLLSTAVRRKCLMDDLISKVVKNFQQEINTARKQKWDAVLLSQYLYELREAKKQGRKERRHKEAQAVLAAATAAAAASSRISSLRKDALEESAHMEELPKGNLSNGRPVLYSQQNPRVKETISRSAASRLSSEKNSDPFSLASEFSVEHARTCEICGRCETILNSILVCSSCKVAVHLDCYRGVKNSTGPWYCELCDDLLLSRGSGVPSTNSWDKPYFIAECGLCGGTAGAFRKSMDGQWIHAFCAEWVLESTFRRGQVNPIDGLGVVSKGGDICVICSRKQGVCIKCSYGNCQSTFHASCARSTGFYMSARTSSGKLQHKAYCAKHSLEQKAKAETQKHGAEELKSLKLVRVELERLRLLCERIIKREKLKRELVLCSHDILASNRDAAVLSALSRHPLYNPDLSSESATTSTRGYTDGNKSGSDTIQRSDDITVDSTVAGKRRIKLPLSMDNEQKTDDSSVSQHFVTQKPIERVAFSGKQVRRPAVASRNLPEDAEKWSRLRKHPETFETELVMTSDQASMKNQRLPKGYVYVPIQCLSKEKETPPDACSREQLEHDG